MGQTKNTPSRRETALSWTIMAVLMVIASGVFTKQFYYDPNVLIPTVTEAHDLAKLAPESFLPSDLVNFVPVNMGPMNPLEWFGPDNLSDKINGKAELYLSAGFLTLQCRRFVQNADPESWMEAFVYDMGTVRQAFAVYSAQRRAEAKPLDLTRFSYRTQNALFFVHGGYYVEIIASVASETMMDAMIFLGKALVSRTSVEEETIHELDFFPTDHLQEEGVVLLVSNAFGFDGMKNVFAGRYHVNGEELTAFLTQTDSGVAAEKLVAAFRAFLVANGGTDIPAGSNLHRATLVKIMDTFDLFFPHASYVAGVHEAQTKEAAETLALILAKKLAESVKLSSIEVK